MLEHPLCRLAGSSGANPIAISAGIALSLKFPAQMKACLEANFKKKLLAY